MQVRRVRRLVATTAVPLTAAVTSPARGTTRASQRGMSSRPHTQGWFAPMEDASLDIRRWLLPRLGEAS